ncbi:hypothetical protein GOP47_0024102 [Adiantum capillus-veneris]|uniref:Pentatricopeptide repeat-containing protein n=1 Tax=Adiantum capillus-veneris TaxID=13818 RepID=A0A9D4Z5T6_ADICA|nr:hypothetical protein GOP47_0024102 [Adiantum capillus-veneris]
MKFFLVEVKTSFGKFGTLACRKICLTHSLTAVSFSTQTGSHEKTRVEYEEELGPAQVARLCQEHKLEEAFQVVAILRKHGCLITRDLIYSLLQGCIEKSDLEACRIVHRLMVDSGFDGTVVLVDHLIRLFTSYRSLGDANRVFNRLHQPTIHTWNALLTAHTKLGQEQRALYLFHTMDQWGIKPDIVTFLCALKACSNLHNIDNGRLVHKQVMNLELGSNTILGNAIIDMYAKCGDLKEAVGVFEKLSSRDIVSWGSLITGYVQHGQALPAIKLFEQILQQGVKPSKVVFLGAFKACSILSAGTWGRLIHTGLIQTEISTDLVINNSLIDMYTKCGLMTDAQSLFNCLQVQDEVSWATMISGFVTLEDPEQALRYFDQMLQRGLKPNGSSYSSLVKACGLLKAIMQGMHIHYLILVSKTALDMVVCSSLIDMYVKCEALQEALNVFNTLPFKDLVSWGTMISGYCTLGHGFAALELFGQMQQNRTNPDNTIIISLVKACGDIGSVNALMLMHHYVMETEIDADGSARGTFIDIYAKCGCMKEAYAIFGGLQNRDPMSWCSMIGGYMMHGDETLALDLFEIMQFFGMEQNRVVLLCALQACGSLGFLYQSRIIHDKIVRSNYELDVAIANTLIDVYSKCGSLEAACKVFETLSTLDVVPWCTMLAGYVMHGQNLKALEFFLKLQDKGIEMNPFMFSSVLKACGTLKELDKGRCIHNEIINGSLETDVVVGNSLILMYSRQGHLEDAYWVLKSLRKRDGVSWATMIAARSEYGCGLSAMQDFEEMQNEGVHPSIAALVCTLKACGSIRALPQGRIIHNLVVLGDLEKDVVVGRTLVEFYSRSGSIDEAWRVLSALPHQEAVAWGALIAGCAHHGNTRLARGYFYDMLGKGIKPDSGVFTGLLAACSQEGSVEEGHDFFKSMLKDFNVSPGVQHYSCIIDLFGRAGHFDQAMDIIDMMPDYPDLVIWMSLLTSCRTYTNVSMANWCFEELLKLEAVDAACYILMSNIYANANLWQDAKRVRQLIYSGDARKQLGIALLKVDSGVHEFVVGGENNPQEEEVSVKIDKLAKLLKNEGFVASLNLVLEPFSSETEEAMRIDARYCI